MTAPSSPDPAPHDPGLRVEGSSPDGLGGRTSTTASPQWTWTDEARDAVLISAWGVRLGEAWTDDRASADAVLAVLAPHAARQVADLTAEVKRLRIALATVNTSFDAVSAREAIRSELINQGLAAAEQVDTLRRQVTQMEAENDNYHADLIRVIGERDAALAKLDAVKALHERGNSWTVPAGVDIRSFHPSDPPDGYYCRCCDQDWPCATVRALAADPQRAVLPPEDVQDPRTPAPGSPGTPETLSVPLSAPRDPHGA